MEYLIKASAVVILFYLCYSLFLKKETFFQHNRWFLIIGLITALVFPLIVIPIEVIVEPTLIPEASFYTDSTSSTSIIPAKKNIEWQDVFPVLYGLGFIVFFIQFILQFGSLIILLFKNPKTKDGIYTYIIVKNKVSPFSFFKWIVYNPELFEEEELKLILKHEKVHVRQLHSLDIVITRLACVTFWFNPIMWLYKKDIHQNLEFIADDTTQNAATHGKKYQHLLVKTSVANQHIPITTNFYNSLIKKRIIMLNKSRSHQKNRWKYVLIIPFLTALLLSTNTKEIYIEAASPTNSLEVPSFEKAPYSHKDNAQLPTPMLDAETVEILFNKNSSDTYLEDIKSQLNDKGVEMDIKTLERNKKDEITKINITFTTKTGSTNYSVSDLNGIKPFAFKMKGNGSFGVGPVEKNNVWVAKQKSKGTNTFTFKTDENEELHKGDGELHFSDDDDNVFYLNGKAKIRTSTNGKNVYVSADSIKMKHANGYAYRVDSNDSTKVFVRSTSNDPLYIINGKRMSKAEVHVLNPKNIDRVNVLKDKSATSIYGTDGANGVFVIELKEPNKLKIKSDNSFEMFTDTKNKNYLYLYNGKEISRSDLEKVYSNESVGSLIVLNEKEGKRRYGKKGENGVVIVKSKSTDDNEFTIIRDQSPWKVRTAVTSVEFIDDEHPSESGFSYYVTKLTTKKELANYKSELESRGIKTKFSKIKRNDAGEITSIKISLTDESGSKASATWQDDIETIPNLLVGKKAGKLRVTSTSF